MSERSISDTPFDGKPVTASCTNKISGSHVLPTESLNFSFAEFYGDDLRVTKWNYYQAHKC